MTVRECYDANLMVALSLSTLSNENKWYDDSYDQLRSSINDIIRVKPHKNTFIDN